MTNILYKVIRPIVKFILNNFIRPKYYGLENIPMDGRIILAGTHTHVLDAILVMSTTKRQVHFLAKDELWKGPKKLLFSNLGLIPVNRREKDHNALVCAENYLKKECVIGIFPEGTTEKNRGLLPFKIGAVKMAYDTNTKIVPFVIKGRYKLFSRNLKIILGKPIAINDDDLSKENERFRNIIISMMEE